MENMYRIFLLFAKLFLLGLVPFLEISSRRRDQRLQYLTVKVSKVSLNVSMKLNRVSLAPIYIRSHLFSVSLDPHVVIFSDWMYFT